jgi:hypothetical protein
LPVNSGPDTSTQPEPFLFDRAERLIACPSFDELFSLSLDYVPVLAFALRKHLRAFCTREVLLGAQISSRAAFVGDLAQSKRFAPQGIAGAAFEESGVLAGGWIAGAFVLLDSGQKLHC